MNRLSIVMIAACIFICGALFASGCNNSGDSVSFNQGSNPISSPVIGPYIYTYSSSDADNHNHTARVYSTAYSTPDAAGWSDTSTSVMDHTHTMAITQVQLTAINGGVPLTVASSTATNPSTGVSHSHSWTISKQFIQASSADQNHSHDLIVPYNDLANPPGGGMNYTSSTALNHNHTISLTQGQLTSLNSGSAVTINTGNATNPISGQAHFHVYSNLLKPW